MRKKIEFDRCSLLAGRPRTHWLDLELPFLATLAWSCRCLSVRSPYTPPPFFPSYHIRALKNTLLDTHEPPVPFPGPTETRTFVRKPCFFLLLAAVNSVERIAAACARFLSPSHEEERTDADVNTGNDTNTKKKAQKSERTCME